MMSDPTKACPSRLTLELLLQNELDTTAEKEATDHVNACDRCSEWMEAARKADAASSVTLDSNAFARKIIERHEATRPQRQVDSSTEGLWAWFRGHQISALAAAACCLLLVFGVLRFLPEARLQPAHDDQVAIKGTDSFKIYCQRGDQVFELQAEQRVQTGDRLRFEVFSEGLSHALLLGLQADGEIAVYAPFGGEESVAIARGKVGSLQDQSIELDASAEDELLVLLLSHKAIKARAAIKALREAFVDAGRRLGEVDQVPVVAKTLTRPLRRKGSP